MKIKNMSKVQGWIIATAACGFASFISFFQVDGDYNEGGWIVSGIVTGLACLFSFKQVVKNTGGGGSQEK